MTESERLQALEEKRIADGILSEAIKECAESLERKIKDIVKEMVGDTE